MSCWKRFSSKSRDRLSFLMQSLRSYRHAPAYRTVAFASPAICVIDIRAVTPQGRGPRFRPSVRAPKDARAKFADWNGRRVDGRSIQGGEHRWTDTIVSGVFDQPFPKLLSANEIGLVGGGDQDIDNAAAFRIALLWDELVAKLHTTPTAALGLLDIANSGKVRDSLALEAVEPSIADAAPGFRDFPEVEASNSSAPSPGSFRDGRCPGA